MLKVRLPKPPPEDHSVVLSTTNLVSQTASASVMKSFFTSLSLVLILHLVPFSVFFVDKSKSFDFESLATVQNAYHQTSESISKNYNQSNKTGSWRLWFLVSFLFKFFFLLISWILLDQHHLTIWRCVYFFLVFTINRDLEGCRISSLKIISILCCSHSIVYLNSELLFLIIFVLMNIVSHVNLDFCFVSTSSFFFWRLVSFL